MVIVVPIVAVAVGAAGTVFFMWSRRRFKSARMRVRPFWWPVHCSALDILPRPVRLLAKQRRLVLGPSTHSTFAEHVPCVLLSLCWQHRLRWSEPARCCEGCFSVQ